MCESRIGEAYFFRQKFSRAVMGKCENERVCGFFAADIKDCRFERAVFETQAAYRRAQGYLPALFFNGRAAAVGECGKRDGGDAHSVAGAIGEKCFPENVDAKAGVGAVEFFIESADKDHSPEAFDGGGSLFASSQPLHHRDRFDRIGVLWTATGKKNGGERTSDGQLVRKGERREKQKRAGHVDGSGQNVRFHNACHALRVEKHQAVEELDFVGGANAFVEVFKISAAAERDVLAIVYMLAIRQSIGSGAAAEVGPLFEEAYAAAGVSQRDSRC